MRELWKGNEAMAEAAVRAGLEMYIGYPITPQTEICEYLALRMPELGRTFIQSESELISINSLLGCGLTGARGMASSSGVGISLMQEGITACFANSAPGLIVNVNRSGCGMGGNFEGGQDDWLWDTRGGGNGDYRLVVMVPKSIQEAVDLTYQSFDIAEKYRTPVEIMTEGRLGQMVEAVEMPEFRPVARTEWAMDGSTKNRPGKPLERRPWDYFRRKIQEMEANEQRWESYRTEDAETVVVAVGLCSRICKGVVDRRRAKGERIGLLRPITAWPFPQKGFEALPESVKRIVSVELSNAGQMIEDVLITAKRVKKLQNVPIYARYHYLIPTTEELMSFLDRVENNEIKEVE